MKNTKRFPRLLVAALVLAASGAIAPGCARPEERPAPDHRGQAVTVVVTYNPDTKKAEILDPDPEKRITLRKNKDWAVWYSPAGLVYVSFTKGSPFDDSPKHERDKKILKSGPAKNKGSFVYDAKLVLTGDTEDKGITIDPKIEVVD